MEYIKQILRKSGTVAIVESIIFAILGIILVTKPEETVKVISYIIGAGLIIIGAYKVFVFLKEKKQKDLYNYQLVYGVMAIVIGLISIVYSATIGSIFRIIIGMWIIYSSVVRASSALKLKAIKSNIWIYTLILAIAMFACGLYVVLNEGTVVVTIGILMIIYSIMDIIENIIFLQHVNDLD